MRGLVLVLTVLIGCQVHADAVQQPIVIWSDGTRLAGNLWKPKDLAPDAKVPGVLLVHGWGGLKSHLNLAYAPQFASQGYVVLTFDYRGWGESDGKFVRVGDKPEGERELTLKVAEVREIVDPLDQLEDIRNALAYLMGESQVDSDRIGIWGSSLGGGLAVQTAGQFPQIKVLISQVGAVDNLGNLQARDPASEGQKNTWAYQIQRVRGEFPPFPGAEAAIPGLGGVPDYNSMMRYDPFAWVDRVNAATLIVDAEEEELFNRMINGKATYERLKDRVPAEYHALPGKHYDIYRDKGYEKAMALEIGWLKKHLPTDSEK